MSTKINWSWPWYEINRITIGYYKRNISYVVGSISNQQEVKEIETVAKVFVVAERIYDLTYDQKSANVTKPPMRPAKKRNKCIKTNNSWSHFLTVHGFN